MKRQVLMGALLSGMLMGMPILADDINDFSSDPVLSTEWTSSAFYDYHSDDCSSTTATWNDVNQNLDLVSDYEEGIKQLYKTGTTRSDSDGITATYSNLNFIAISSSWNVVGLLLSSVQDQYIFDTDPSYGILLEADIAADGITPTYYYKVNGAANQRLFRYDIDTLPSTIKFDIQRDDADYVFLVNDQEIYRDSSYAMMSMPYYSMFWGTGGNSGITVQADDFGVVSASTPITPPSSPGVIDFSVDPNLSTDWAVKAYYDYHGDGCPNTTATWNETNQNLDLASTGEEGLNLLYKKNTIRDGSEGVTATFSNVNVTSTESNTWAVAGLLLSSYQSLGLFDAVPAYGFLLEADVAADGETYSYYYKINSAANNQLFRYDIDAIPETIKFDILQDDSEYVFLVNGEEIFRDATYISESLPYFSMFWGGGGTCEMTLQADDFGTITATEPVAGDANGDGKVDGSDVTILAGNWQKGVSDGQTAIWEDGDFNGDGKVDGSDVTILAGNWQYGVEAVASAVPEPSTLMMVIMLASGLMIRRRRSA